MNILAINTAFTNIGVSLMKNNELAGNYYSVCKKRGEQVVFHVLDDLLSNAQMQLEQIDCFVVVQGPGSYTGLRIGMAVAKTLAQVHQRPVIGITSIELLASMTSPLQVPFYVLLNCTRTEVFYAQFRFEGLKTVQLSEIRLSTLESLWEQIQGHAVVYKQVAAPSSASTPLLEKLKCQPFHYPIADAFPLLELGRERFAACNGKFPNVLPIYLKKDVVGRSE
ncbi:MAG: tRNA (adenosine(37)-N6)-threonylcarbamoyltransferase complex dimerization subunit type 1 TsaB [SAR324 cluster bacterium]|nr:tRNA (adenosine(37)-N6)-threonylcarbamoyltransferase complex dimerization subunit type 1 TsaB [SAR324 cluster bacterium]